MSVEEQLNAVFAELLAEAGRNDQLRRRLTEILEGASSAEESPARRSARRKPAAFDPMAVYRQEPGDLPNRLGALSVDELKDIIAEHGMDRTRLARRWKDKDRLIELIVNAAKSRAQKGDAFRAPMRGRSDDGKDSV